MAVIKRYFLLGHEVDEATHKKYTTQKYSFLDRLVGLDGVQLWATSQEIAEKLPEYAEAARKIIAEIEEEIGVKTKENQKKTFYSFLEGLQTIYKTSVANYEAAQNAFDIAKKDYQATMEDHNAPEHIKAIATGDFERAKMLLQQEQQNVLDNYNSKARELREQMATFADDLYRMTPDRIDQSAMQLLNLGIMSAEEMEHMAEKFRDNPPMLRVIGKFAKEKAAALNGKADQARPYNTLSHYLSSVGDSSNAMSSFDSLMEYGRSGLGKDTTLARIHARHWDRLYSTAADSYTNFIVQPSGAPVE